MREKNVFIIRWFGPFSSRKELSAWEKKRNQQHEFFFLYLFQGKRRDKKKYKYYCGMTYHRKNDNARITKRMRDVNHHIHQFEEERPNTITIWVGTFANVSRPKKSDVKLCEKMLTSELTIELDEKEHENKTNKKPPQETVYIINEWFYFNKIDDEGYYVDYQSTSKDVIPNKVPDVMCYFVGSKKGSLYWARKLKRVAQL